jgi:superfamily II DNA/RNA helicase
MSWAPGRTFRLGPSQARYLCCGRHVLRFRRPHRVEATANRFPGDITVTPLMRLDCLFGRFSIPQAIDARRSSETSVHIHTLPRSGQGEIMTTSFADLGLSHDLVRTLAKRGITEPFPVQAVTIPDAIAGRDVSGKAPTGSGKTLAFGLPLLTNVDRATRMRPRALILAPTRELAEQIKQELAPLASAVNRNVFAVYGGVSYGPQKAILRKGLDVLVATPGRLEDLMEQRSVDLKDVDIVVVDEADRMADMGFMPAVRRILDRTSRTRQTLLFSATLDGDIAILSRDYQSNPIRHEAESIEPETSDARHHFWLVDHHDRVRHTADIIGAGGRSIVFTRTRHGADRLAKQLGNMGIKAVSMHGGRSQAQRNRALQTFSSGRAQALIATDVAARGIHVDSVETVIHFDPPADHKDYLHRSGRTARAGAAGTVVSMITHGQKRTARRMQADLALNAPIEAPRPEALLDGGYLINSQDGSNGRPARKERVGNRPERQPRSPKAGSKSNGNNDGTDVNDDIQSVYVTNLPWDASNDDLLTLFAQHGSVQQATVITDRRTGRSRGFGFVDMAAGDADTAVAQLNGASMAGRDLTVRIARPRAGRR